MNPFEQNYLNKKFISPKNTTYEGAYDLNEEAEVLDDEREPVNTRLLSILVASILIVLFGRLYFLQSVKGSEYEAVALGNKLRVTATQAPRGLIVDKYGKTIASNMPNFELDVIPVDLSDDAQVLLNQIAEISRILNMDPALLQAKILSFDRESATIQTLVESIPKDAALILMSKGLEFEGFTVANNPIRDYKEPYVFSSIIGYTGKITKEELNNHQDQDYLYNDYIGKTGLEIQYESDLRGISGRKQYEIDAEGNVSKTLAEVEASPGNNIKLNIDYDLQKVLYDSMKSVMDRSGKTKAAAVATNPKNGQVLALVSMPSFDNSLFAHGISSEDYNKLITNKDRPLLNRVVSGLYPPGSTVKPVMAMAALSEGVVKPTTQILDDGVIRVGTFTYYGYNRAGLGVMDVYSAIAKSSDIYFYTVGGGRAGTSIQGLGPEKIANWLRKFHTGSVLGIDIPGERQGLVPDTAWKKAARNEPWYLGDSYHYAIGQSALLATPLQVNNWTATIANNGKIMQPQILNQVVDRDGRILRQQEPKVLAENQFNDEFIKAVQEGMRQTVTIGSAQALKSVGMSVAGKTGTAQFVDRNLDLTHAWFTSYAPFEDPQIALTVLVEAAGEGSTYSVPITKSVYDWYVANRLNK